MRVLGRDSGESALQLQGQAVMFWKEPGLLNRVRAKQLRTTTREPRITNYGVCVVVHVASRVSSRSLCMCLSRSCEEDRDGLVRVCGLISRAPAEARERGGRRRECYRRLRGQEKGGNVSFDEKYDLPITKRRFDGKVGAIQTTERSIGQP